MKYFPVIFLFSNWINFILASTHSTVSVLYTKYFTIDQDSWVKSYPDTIANAR